MHGRAPEAVVRIAARAKVNLALHVVGRRADGYHELDSLVGFASVADGDIVTVTFGDGPVALEVTGPFAADVPAGRANVVVAAAEAVGGIASVRLRKGFPVASGIGGGSADAAAVLRAVSQQRGIDTGAFAALALALGADVPVCLAGEACRMEGIGERLSPVALPPSPIVLVNPGVPVATPAVFARLERRSNPPLLPLPPLPDTDALVRYLLAARNDLEAPARALAPAIAAALAAVAAEGGCRLARMSGSGATVFGLFADRAARDAAAVALASARPDWWVRPATVG